MIYEKCIFHGAKCCEFFFLENVLVLSLIHCLLLLQSVVACGMFVDVQSSQAIILHEYVVTACIQCK